MGINYPQHHVNKWYQQALGAWLLEIERRQLSRILSKCHGDYLMQLGGSNDLLHSLDAPVNCRFHVVAELPTAFEYPHIQASFDHLPIQPEMINVALLVHMLEFTNTPVQLLRDIYQTLAPGGQLIIVGFNPWSSWGLVKLFKKKYEWPWNGKFWSRAQITHWLRSHGYTIGINKTVCFRSPYAKPSISRCSSLIEHAGQLCLPTFGGVYLIVARKKMYRPISQGATWWKKRSVIRGV